MTLEPGFRFLEVAYPYVARRLLTDEDPALRERLIAVRRPCPPECLTPRGVSHPELSRCEDRNCMPDIYMIYTMRMHRGIRECLEGSIEGAILPSLIFCFTHHFPLRRRSTDYIKIT